MEVKKFNQIKEELTFDDKRMTKITDILINDESISGVENIDWIDVQECTIFWDYELNVSKSAIDYIMPTIVKILISVEVMTYDEGSDTDDSVEKEYEYDIMNSDIDTESEDGIQKLPFMPSEIEFSHLETSEDNKVKIKIVF